MTSQWNWIALGVLIVLVLLCQEFRIHRIHQNSKKHEELFQIVTENAADMIALADMRGRRLYNSPAYKRVLGDSAAELGETSSFEQIHPDHRFKVLEAARKFFAHRFGTAPIGSSQIIRCQRPLAFGLLLSIVRRSLGTPLGHIPRPD
jgi:PAS domain-containing protein